MKNSILELIGNNSADQKILVIGTGGGHDIGSAALIAKCLSDSVHADVAGILSPAAYHIFDNQGEGPINQIQKRIDRYIPQPKDEMKSIGMTDSLWREWLQDSRQETTFYNFSLLSGSEELHKEMCAFLGQKGYTDIIAVDVGGDILGTAKDSTLLSPMMDFATLRMLRHIGKKTKIHVRLLEFGLGTDGELRTEGIDRILNESNLGRGVGEYDDTVKGWAEFYHAKIETYRSGNTVPVTLEALQQKRGNIPHEYRVRRKIGGIQHQVSIPLEIDAEKAAKIILIDPQKVQKHRSNSGFFKDPLHLWLQCKNTQPAWTTECDGFHFWINSAGEVNNIAQGMSVFLGAFGEIWGNKKLTVVRNGMRSEADCICLLRDDFETYKQSFDEYEHIEYGNIVFVIKDATYTERLKTYIDILSDLDAPK